MPYKSEKMCLPEHLDRRRKLTSEQKDKIKHKYSVVGEERNAVVREHRHYKQKLYVEGKLKEE